MIIGTSPPSSPVDENDKTDEPTDETTPPKPVAPPLASMDQIVGYNSIGFDSMIGGATNNIPPPPTPQPDVPQPPIDAHPPR